MTIETRQQRSDRASRELGRYLLLGWTMTGDVCPNPGCGCVLMRSAQGAMLCVLCGEQSSATRAAMSQPAAAARAVPAGPAPPPQPAPSTAAQLTSVRNLDLDNDEDIEALIRQHTSQQRQRITSTRPATQALNATPASRPTDASSIIGQRMLQGWTLLGDVCKSCEAVPLIRRQDQLECVVCGPVNGGEPRPQAPPSVSPAFTTAAELMASTPINPQASSSNSQRRLEPKPPLSAAPSVHIGMDMSNTLRVAGLQIHQMTERLEKLTDPQLILEHTKALRELIHLASDAKALHS